MLITVVPWFYDCQFNDKQCVPAKVTVNCMEQSPTLTTLGSMVQYNDKNLVTEA